MNIVIEIDNFNKDHIFLQEPVKNNIIDDSKFIRIIYSNNIFAVNTVYIVFNLHIIQIENYFNKLHKINSDNEFIIKISGIWENEYEYGITYKFVDMSVVTHPS